MTYEHFSRILIFAVVFFFLAGLLPAGSSAKEHRPIWLFNEQGDRIIPSANAIDPYSPKKTCGVCHDYGIVTKGYHFQQGFDEMKAVYAPRRPWILSPGMFGNYFPFAGPAQLAAKNNSHIRQIDLTTYDWIGGLGKKDAKGRDLSRSCGACHPGGGPLEYGRGPQGRPDLTVNLINGEKSNRTPLDGDYTSLMTPDGRSHFRESGVIEADCLICHGPAYRFEARIEQINRRNYRWAATAGAGLGSIKGAIFTYSDPTAGPGQPRYLDGTWNLAKRPVVTYAWHDRKIFTPEGRLSGAAVSRSVSSRNCLQCHAAAEATNTGHIHNESFDAHAAQGLRCTDCHPLTGKTAVERMQHQIAKGRSGTVHVRNDLDGIGMKTCAGCHLDGQYRPTRRDMPTKATNPAQAHGNRFPRGASHFYLISCSGCHATSRPARGMALLDLSTGTGQGYTADDLALAFVPEIYEQKAREPWPPWVTRAKREKGGGEYYTAHAPKGIQWFGEEQKNGEIRPIPLRFVKEAADGLQGLTTRSVKGGDGTTRKITSILSDGDIRRMIGTLTKQGFRSVVYLSDQVYRLKGITLTAGPRASRQDIFTVSHGVTPLSRQWTYGAKGCRQCHEENAPFFTKKTIRNMRGFLRDDYPELRAPNSIPQMTEWGMEDVPSY
jgi:hypothetical protein